VADQIANTLRNSRAPRELADTEARRIIEECYEQALATVRGSRDRLDRLAHTLMDRETLDEDEAYAAAGIRPGSVPAAVARDEAGESPRKPGMAVSGG
jgi:cell division protease FtsH